MIDVRNVMSFEKHENVIFQSHTDAITMGWAYFTVVSALVKSEFIRKYSNTSAANAFILPESVHIHLDKHVHSEENKCKQKETVSSNQSLSARQNKVTIQRPTVSINT